MSVSKKVYRTRKSWGASAAILVSALFLQAPGAIASQVSLPDQSAAPGSSVPLPAMFLSQGDLVSGIQFDLQYDNSAMDLVAIAGDAARNSEKSLYYSDLAPNLIASPPQVVHRN